MNMRVKKNEKKNFFYCKLCDFGTFSKDTMNTHNETEKHKKYILRTKKNDI